MNAVALPEVLVVEDGPADRTMWLKGILSSKIPCHVTVRSGAVEALAYLRDAEKPTPTLIVLDHRMPKLNGLELLGRLRLDDKTRFVPVVVFTTTDAESDVTECYRGGANSCVTRPSDRRGYVDRLARIARYWLTVDRLWDHRRTLQPAGCSKGSSL